jgi:hypothetical protein
VIAPLPTEQRRDESLSSKANRNVSNCKAVLISRGQHSWNDGGAQPTSFTRKDVSMGYATGKPKTRNHFGINQKAIYRENI